MFRLSAIAAAIAFVVTSAAADRLPVRPIYTFHDLTDGWSPIVAYKDSRGALFGYTYLGGDTTACPNGCGTIFKLRPDGKKTVLHTFHSADGADATGIAVDSAGTIYGTVHDGGTGGGSVFKLTRDGQFSTLFTFPTAIKHQVLQAPDGMWPANGVLVGQDGNLYGTASYGGINNHCGEGGCGTVFKLTPGGAFTLLHAFGGETGQTGDGCHPSSGLIQDAQGALYGTTAGCGHTDFGTVYKTDPATGVTTTLHTFTAQTDGDEPSGGLTMDEAGNLYGVTLKGGSSCNGGSGCGTVYKVGPDGTETVFYAFKSFADGLFPMGSLYRDSNGVLYGVTFFGGASALFNCAPTGCGSLFKIAPDGKKTTLYSFSGYSGDLAGPTSGLTPGPRPGTFYGSTQYSNGMGCCGAVFEYKPTR